jgi:LAS superfamily LD-carboxypeptidase LdcB
MLNSTAIGDLHPIVALKATRLIVAAGEIGLQLVIVSTLRDAEAQAKRYALGRTELGPQARPGRALGVCVTSNAPGESLHEYGCAFDCFPTLAGYALTGAQTLEWRAWVALRELAALPRINLQWGGYHRAEGCLRELWHFHYCAGLTAAELKAGAQLPAVTLGEPSRARAPRRKRP